MTTWITVPGTWYHHKDKVTEICTRNFGPAHVKTHNKKTGRTFDNHGNWKFFGGALKFRYQKDYAWFMLQASHLKDAYRVLDEWPYFTNSTGPK